MASRPGQEELPCETCNGFQMVWPVGKGWSYVHGQRGFQLTPFEMCWDCWPDPFWGCHPDPFWGCV